MNLSFASIEFFFGKFLNEALWVFHEAAIYIVVGFFVAGIISVFIPKEFLNKFFGKKGFKSVLKASLIGIPLPLCSCGVIPAAASLRKQGASKGSTVAFLISTPETGVDSISMTYALLDPIMVVFRPLASFITAVVSGLWVDLGTKEDPEEVIIDEQCNVCGQEHDHGHKKHGFVEKAKRAFQYAYGDMIRDLGKLLVIGFLLAALISAFVPENFFEEYVGNYWLTMFLMLIIGIPIYVCATASTPIAAALILKGISPGAALVFLLAGPATNITTQLVVGKLLGKRAVIIYLVSIMIVSLGMGLFLDVIYGFLDISPKAVVGSHHHFLPEGLKWAGAFFLGFLLIFQVIKQGWLKKVKKHGLQSNSL